MLAYLGLLFLFVVLIFLTEASTPRRCRGVGERIRARVSLHNLGSDDISQRY